MTSPCLFCQIRDGEIPAHRVLDEPHGLAFLDSRPLFPGHALLIPRIHYPTLAEVPAELVGPLFLSGQRLAGAVQDAMGADGTFLAVNNTVSQSVAHVHLHVVPRRRKDGLRGFFWPRQRYEDDAAAEDVAAAIRTALTVEDGP